MITAVFKKENDEIVEYTIMGHADYDELGKDVVCAAVSSLHIAITNKLIQCADMIDDSLVKVCFFNDPVRVTRTINHSHDDIIGRSLVDALFDGLSDIAEQYPEHVEVLVADETSLPEGTKILDVEITKKLLDG